jgi:predicted DNA-binding transcriptional regulator AlpA
MKGSAPANRVATLVEGPLLRPEQAAHLLSVKTSWVYEAVRSGRVPCIREADRVLGTHTFPLHKCSRQRLIVR